MDWKQSLDRWLQNEPHDGFGDYCESVIGNAIDDKFYNENQDFIFDKNGGYTNDLIKLLNQCFADGMSIQGAARFIESTKTQKH